MQFVLLAAIFLTDCPKPEVDSASNLQSRARGALVVKDNEEVAAGQSAVLGAFGCKVRHELKADDALRVLKEAHVFDVIPTDVHMPGLLNGIDLAERVPQHWRHKRLHW